MSRHTDPQPIDTCNRGKSTWTLHVPMSVFEIESEPETHLTWEKECCANAEGSARFSECSLTLAAPSLGCWWCCLCLWLDGQWKKGACCSEAANIWGICQWTSAQAERCLCGSQRDIPSHYSLTHHCICPFIFFLFCLTWLVSPTVTKRHVENHRNKLLFCFKITFNLGSTFVQPSSSPFIHRIVKYLEF